MRRTAARAFPLPSDGQLPVGLRSPASPSSQRNIKHKIYYTLRDCPSRSRTSATPKVARRVSLLRPTRQSAPGSGRRPISQSGHCPSRALWIDRGGLTRLGAQADGRLMGVDQKRSRALRHSTHCEPSKIEARLEVHASSTPSPLRKTAQRAMPLGPYPEVIKRDGSREFSPA